MDIRFPILEEIEKNGNCIDFVTLLNKIDATPITTHGVLEAMIQEDLISGTLKANSTVKIKPAGFVLLSQLRADAQEEIQRRTNENAQKEANAAQIVKDKKQKFRHDFKVALFSILIGYFVEHFPKIVHIVLSLFK